MEIDEYHWFLAYGVGAAIVLGVALTFPVDLFLGVAGCLGLGGAVIYCLLLTHAYHRTTHAIVEGTHKSYNNSTALVVEEEDVGIENYIPAFRPTVPLPEVMIPGSAAAEIRAQTEQLKMSERRSRTK